MNSSEHITCSRPTSSSTQFFDRKDGKRWAQVARKVKVPRYTTNHSRSRPMVLPVPQGPVRRTKVRTTRIDRRRAASGRQPMYTTCSWQTSSSPPSSTATTSAMDAGQGIALACAAKPFAQTSDELLTHPGDQASAEGAPDQAPNSAGCTRGQGSGPGDERSPEPRRT